LLNFFVRKAALVKEMGENCAPIRHNVIEREISELAAKLNALDPPKPTPNE
jgi:hypothetical protein